jgi:uncharacterized membrane protein
MKKVIQTTIAIVLATFVGLVIIAQSDHEWGGVDEGVIEAVAEEHGRAPGEPFLNTDKGDLLLFGFLIAGAGGGFIGGYLFRHVFPPEAGEGRAETA